MVVYIGSNDDDSRGAQRPECRGPAMSPAPCHSTSKDWYAHRIGHMLASEDVVECPGVKKVIEPVTDKVEHRVYKEDDLQSMPHHSEIPLERRR